MDANVDQTLLDGARAIAPVVRAHADEGERERRLSKATIDALADAGFLRLYVPASLGGLEADPVTVARVIEEVSRADSAAGWAIMVANAVAWWARALPDDGAEEIYADSPDSFIATAFHPPVTATEVEGGYRLTGSAPLASNVHAAPWLMLTGIVTDDGEPRMADGAPVAIGAIFRTDDADVADTWHAIGMRATDSSDVSVTDVFVPARRTFAFNPVFDHGRHYGGPLYRAPAFAAALAPWTTVALAIAREAIDELVSIAQGKTPFVATTTLRERASAQAKVGRAEALVRSARSLLYGALGEAWDRTLRDRPASLEDKIALLLAGVHAVQSAAAAVELMYGAAGTTAIYSTNPLARHFRDIQVLRQHGFLSENRYETAGQVLLGLDPDLGLAVF